MVTSHARVVDPSSFSDYLGAVSNYLGFESPDDLLEGVGRVSGAHYSVDFAVRRHISFAAFRWVDVSAKTSEVESFFVWPWGKPAHSGVRVQNMSAGPLEAPENPFFQRWQDVTKGQNASPGARLPGFLELVHLLSSDGQSQSANADLLLQLRFFESELHYSRLTAVERERDLAIAQENLKLMSVRSRETARDALKRRAAPASEPVSEAAGSRAACGLADLPEWAQANAERIVVLPRALSGAKKSQYENPALIMEALEFLASDYREHKCGNLSLAEFNERLKNQPFQLANSVGWGIAGEQGDQYFVRWGKRRVFLDQHLLKGGGREPRYCMRIYFFFDDASGRCVIGSLPHHLANSLS